MAYQWKMPNSDWFIEPSAGIIISRIKVDPFNYLTAGASGPFGDDRLSGTLQLNDIKSDIGRLGLRLRAAAAGYRTSHSLATGPPEQKPITSALATPTSPPLTAVPLGLVCTFGRKRSASIIGTKQLFGTAP
jgi:hypothetical protein